MAGADPFAIMKAMGPADFKTTMIYVSLHSMEEEAQETVSAVEGLLYRPSSRGIETTPNSRAIMKTMGNYETRTDCKPRANNHR